MAMPTADIMYDSVLLYLSGLPSISESPPWTSEPAALTVSGVTITCISFLLQLVVMVHCQAAPHPRGTSGVGSKSEQKCFLCDSRLSSLALDILPEVS